jgi:hypothetical protein
VQISLVSVGCPAFAQMEYASRSTKATGLCATPIVELVFVKTISPAMVLAAALTMASN